MVELLPKIYLHGNRPSFYDSDSATVLELSANLHGKVNELIDEYNKFVENANKIIVDFTTGAIEDRQVFNSAIRQEFQDFIDIINLKVLEQDTKINNVLEQIKLDLMEFVSAGIAFRLDYNEETEELSFELFKDEEEG